MITLTIPVWFAEYLEANMLPVEIEWLASEDYPGEDGKEKADDLEEVQDNLAKQLYILKAQGA